MHLKAISFGPAQETSQSSDIAKLTFEDGRLAVTVAKALDGKGNVLGTEVVFAYASAFRLLDECDLARYWVSKDYPRKGHICEVRAGGWADEESQLQGVAWPRREWLIATGNGCVSVFSQHEPEVHERSWPFAA
jgi:hypothetical protein